MNRINFLPPWVETNLQPAFYDKESGTVLQQTARMYAKVNQLVRNVNEQNEAIDIYIAKFIELKDYVDSYFDNLDVQEEINNKLDDMVEEGTLQEIITAYVQSNVTWTFDTVADMKLAENLIAGSYAQTLGYHSLNDGGGATYYITDTGSANEHDVIAVGDLFAVYMNTDKEVSIKQFGAKGDGSTDDTEAIQYAVNYAFDHNLNVKVNGTSNFYKITLPIVANVERSSTGYWQGIGNKIIGENIANSRIVKIGDDVYTYHSNPNVNNVNATLICANTNTDMQKGTGIYLDSLSLENYATSAMNTKTSGSMGIYTNVSRSTYKNLNISAYKGIVAIAFSCLYENIVFSCVDTALDVSNGTSNTFRFLYTSGCANPYKINSSYSTLLSVCGDDCTGTMFKLNGMGLSLIDCACESPKLQYVIELLNDFVTIYINNFFMHRQEGDEDNNLSLDDCAFLHTNIRSVIDIEGLSIAEMKALDTDNHNSFIFKPEGNATTEITTTLNNLRYYKNYNGTNNKRIKLWANRPNSQCIQRYSTPTAQFNYAVTSDLKIYPFIGGYYGTDLTSNTMGNSIDEINTGALKTIWMDCKDQYHSESGNDIRYTSKHNQGDVQLFNDPKARNALGYSITEWVNSYTWNVAEIPIVLRGASTDRPSSNKYIGLTYFDTTLGKPIYWDGSNWVDATGTTV